MTGLLLKDALVMRKTLKTYLLFLIFYAAMAVVGVFNLNFVTAFIQVIIMMLPISAFAYDDQSKWDRCAMTLPLSRRAVVSARYLFVVLMLISACAFGLAATIIISIIDSSASLIESLSTVLVSLGVGTLIADIVLPLSYKLGPERARPYLYAVIFLPIILLFGAAKLGLLNNLNLPDLNQLPESVLLGIFSLIPLAALAGLALSWLISCRIVAHKEF